MTSSSKINTAEATRLYDANSAFGAVPVHELRAANSNWPGRRAAFPFGYDPETVAEGERLAIHAMYLGADMLDRMKSLSSCTPHGFSVETARVAKDLIYWGVGAVAMTGARDRER